MTGKGCQCSVLPNEVNILGVRYKVEYVDNPAEVDIFKRESLWGQIDYWTRSIRIYRSNRCQEDVWESLIHEVLHGIVTALKISVLKDQEDAVALLALGFTDTLTRNGWLKVED